MRDYAATLTQDSTIQTASEVSLGVHKTDVAKHAPSHLPTCHSFSKYCCYKWPFSLSGPYCSEKLAF